MAQRNPKYRNEEFPRAKPGLGENQADPRAPLWQMIDELIADVPEEEWARIPTDLAATHKTRLKHRTEPL